MLCCREIESIKSTNSNKKYKEGKEKKNENFFWSPPFLSPSLTLFTLHNAAKEKFSSIFLMFLCTPWSLSVYFRFLFALLQLASKHDVVVIIEPFTLHIPRQFLPDDRKKKNFSSLLSCLLRACRRVSYYSFLSPLSPDSIKRGFFYV